MRKTLFLLTLLILAIICGAANAGKESLPAIYMLLLNSSYSGPAIVPTALNDTGITWSGNYDNGNNTACIASELPDGSNVHTAQDCSHGRDASHDDDSDGHAGFSFTKMDSNGIPLSNQNGVYTSIPWACVRDNVTGLTWEVKTDDNGLHDRGDSYNWYNTEPTANGGADGYADDDGNICHGYDSGDSSTFCNTQAYVARVNTTGWCGGSGWRMPTRDELISIVSYDRSNPSVDTDYFPNAIGSNFVWSGSPNANITSDAWGVNFYYGTSDVNYRHDYRRVRLVRSGR